MSITATISGLYLRATNSFTSLLSLLRTLLYRCVRVLQYTSNTDTESLSYERLQFVAAGKSGVVYGIAHNRVLKEYHDSDGLEVEHRAYQRLGSHPNVAKLFETRTDGSIILERGQVLRTICQSTSADEIPIQKKLIWLRQAAEGYRHLHGCDIIHSDVGCNNLILTSDGYIKIIDFEGCSIDGESADSCYEWFSYRPAVPRVSRSTDIFAFGCAIYEVITGRPPHHELEASDDRYQHVENLYADNHFPDVTDLPLGELMQSCWHGNLTCMDEVIRELEAYRPDS
jgi:serine/threonine protein kinase